MNAKEKMPDVKKEDVDGKKEDGKNKQVEKVKVKEVPKVHDKAIANGFGLRISAKYAKEICRMIKGKTPDAAITRLQDVIDERRAVPMAGLEVAHQKGKGLAGGKFPKNACVAIMEIVKQAKANANILGIENPVIAQAISNRASRPYRKAGRRGKRAHVMIEVRAKISKVKECTN
jgi:ribosomal protein L22